MVWLDWPACSPDLNPAEHLWRDIGKRLADRTIYPTLPTSLAELKDRIEHEWEIFPRKKCEQAIYSMKDRLEACIKAKGGHTKY